MFSYSRKIKFIHKWLVLLLVIMTQAVNVSAEKDENKYINIAILPAHELFRSYQKSSIESLAEYTRESEQSKITYSHTRLPKWYKYNMIDEMDIDFNKIWINKDGSRLSVPNVKLITDFAKNKNIDAVALFKNKVGSSTDFLSFYLIDARTGAVINKKSSTGCFTCGEGDRAIKRMASSAFKEFRKARSHNIESRKKQNIAAQSTGGNSTPSLASPIMKKESRYVFENSNIDNSESVAVVIGNRNYTNKIPSVDYAHNDADEVRQYLIDSLGYREGNIIDLRDASQAQLVSVFGNERSHKAKLFNWIRSGESNVFVYYSGHGSPSLSTGESYLLPVDADPMTVEFNGYPLETLYGNLNKLPAKSCTVVIDACFSGSSQAGTVVKNASSISLKLSEVNEASIANINVLSASGISEVASWDEDASLGLFTRHFLEGVTGKADENKFGNADGIVTLGELRKYLNSEVTYMARRLYNRDQHPNIRGKAEMIFSATK